MNGIYLYTCLHVRLYKYSSYLMECFINGVWRNVFRSWNQTQTLPHGTEDGAWGWVSVYPIQSHTPVTERNTPPEFHKRNWDHYSNWKVALEFLTTPEMSFRQGVSTWSAQLDGRHELRQCWRLELSIENDDVILNSMMIGVLSSSLTHKHTHRTRHTRHNWHPLPEE